jgi:hypothetical protein
MKRFLTTLALAATLATPFGLSAHADAAPAGNSQHITAPHGVEAGVIDATTRPLHAFDNAALWSCAWGRDNGYQQVIHAVPDAIGDGWARYRCRVYRYINGFLVEDRQYWVFHNTNDNTLWKPWASQDCIQYPAICIWASW